MKNYQKLSESDIDRISKKVLQSEQIPELGVFKDIASRLKGGFTGKGYYFSKYISTLRRIAKFFDKKWLGEGEYIAQLYRLEDKIERSDMLEADRERLKQPINTFIRAREDYYRAIEKFKNDLE